MDGTTRRGLLRTAGLLGFSALGASLVGCENTTEPSGEDAERGPGGLPLATKDRPITLPYYGRKPIASGLTPERGPLRIYNWQEYLSPLVVKSFERKYDVKVSIATFTTAEEAIAKLTSTELGYDIFPPSSLDISLLVAGKLLEPLNHSYIPNLKANVWRRMQNPWYDQESRYTVPYTVYTTGIAWRADKMGRSFDPGKQRNPYDTFWQATRYRGKVGLLDDQRDALGMAILRNGSTDINSHDPKIVNAAAKALRDLVEKVNLKFDTNEYQRLGEGSLWLHQAWNGDAIAAPDYVPKGTPKDVIRYWWPADGKGVIMNDTWAVLRGGSNPVLAHLFLDHLLDVKQAMVNFTNTYYQQPLTGMTRDKVLATGLVTPTLRSALVKEEQFEHGYAQTPLSQRAQVLWQNAWAKVKAG